MSAGIGSLLRLSPASLLVVLLAAGTPAVAASRQPAQQQLLLAVSSPYLLAPARIGAQYGVVTSGFRSVDHNRRVGGMPNSYHLLGRAIDVQRRPGVTHAMIDAALRRAGYNLIESLDEIDHSHFAFGPAMPVRYARAVPAAAPEPPLVPPKPPEPTLLADVHGVLVIDEARAPTTAGVAGVP